MLLEHKVPALMSQFVTPPTSTEPLTTGTTNLKTKLPEVQSGGRHVNGIHANGHPLNGLAH